MSSGRLVCAVVHGRLGEPLKPLFLGLLKKLLETWWLRTRRIYYLTVLAGRESCTPSKDARRRNFLSLPALGGSRHPWLVVASLQSLLLSSHGLLPCVSVDCISLCLSKDTCHGI